MKRSLLLAALCLAPLNACQFMNLAPPIASERSFYLPPEYDPIQGVVLSEHLATFPNGKAFLQALLGLNTEIWMLTLDQQNLSRTRTLLQTRFGLNSEQMSQLKALPIATQTVWARDWAPLFSFSTQNTTDIGLLDFKYYPDRQVDDAVGPELNLFLNQTASMLGLQSLFPKKNYRNLPVNVELEGGNVMCTRQNCFVSREVLQRVEAEGITPDPVQITQELEKHLQQKFTIVPRLPYESTGHIDIWAKFLSAKMLIIGEISETSLERVPDEQREAYTEVRDFLNEQATGLNQAGQESTESLAYQLKQLDPEIEIRRIPMPTPGIYKGIETFRTYTNSVLVNQTAIVPRYGRGGRSREGDRDLFNSQESDVEKLYQATGYQVIWIKADNLIRDGGAWHCVAMQIPRLDQARTAP